MRIAVWHNLPSGGGKRAIYDHLRGLVARGHSIEVWCPPSADTAFLPLGEFLPEHVVPLTWPSASLNKGVSGLVSEYQDLMSRIRAMDEHCARCAEQMSAGNFDLLLAHSCRFFRVTSIAHYVQLPAILYLQEPYRWLYEALPRLPWVALPPPDGHRYAPSYWKRFVRDLVKVQALRVQVRAELVNASAFGTILVNSLFSRESVQRAYGLDAKVCYLGVDTAKFISHDKLREDFVVGIGAFVPEKDIPLAIEAVAHVPEPRPSLVWIGNVGSDTYIEELCRLAAAREVVFEPRLRIDDTAVLDLLNRARLLVYAPHLEPFGYAPLEANACELPVVGVAEGGVRETVLDGVNGLLVERAPAALADAIERLRSDDGYARRLGRDGRQLVLERWSLGAAIDRLETRLAEAIHRQP
jgi:glycosyltransferase involved in cell wall biosynthesis